MQPTTVAVFAILCTVSWACVDLTNPRTGTSDCPRMAAYCTNSVYLSLMRTQCPRTCGYCTASSSTVTATSVSSTTFSSTCVDRTNPSTGTSDCTRMASYCRNSIYIPLMRVQCPRTCGFCTSG